MWVVTEGEVDIVVVMGDVMGDLMGDLMGLGRGEVRA